MTDYNFKPKLSRKDYGWHDRNLPHFDGPQQTQFITFRLFDSLPAALLERWRNESADDSEFRKRVEKYLDTGAGECWLQMASVARMVCQTIRFHDKAKYDLIAWVVLPNHVHILLRLLENEHLPIIMHSLKSYTAQMANRILNRSGQFWQHESFDRYIRNEKHYYAVIRYIEQNPVQAGLCELAEDWPYSSAFLG